jgi:hypothetical protein
VAVVLLPEVVFPVDIVASDSKGKYNNIILETKRMAGAVDSNREPRIVHANKIFPTSGSSGCGCGAEVVGADNAILLIPLSIQN